MTGDVTIDLLVILGFTLLLILLLLNYYYRLQARHFDLTEGALGRVDEIRVVESATFAQVADVVGAESADAAGVASATDAPGAAGVGAAAERGRDSAGEPLRIEGSKVMPVGGPSSEFRVLDELPEGAVVSWSSKPAGLATIVVGAGTRTAVVYAATPGTIAVVASVTIAGVTHVGVFEAVAAVATRSKELELPWPGRGLGTLVVIIVLLAVVLLLALQGLIDGAAIAALLTAIAGFAFGVRALEAK